MTPLALLAQSEEHPTVKRKQYCNREVERSKLSRSVVTELTAISITYLNVQMFSVFDGMAEWSKATHLSCVLFGGEGSNPSPVTLAPMAQLAKAPCL